MSLANLKVKYLHDLNPKGPLTPRCYTLTHSDFTGKLFLSIGIEFDKKAISGFYTKIMRDEVLAEWLNDENDYSIHVYCHVSGGIIIGRAGWRDSIFRREMPLVLKAICQGDKDLFISNPDLVNSPIIVHFQSSNKKYKKVEIWGTPNDYL
ncbi:staygreen family protein [Thermoproteota archaeon]